MQWGERKVLARTTNQTIIGTKSRVNPGGEKRVHTKDIGAHQKQPLRGVGSKNKRGTKCLRHHSNRFPTIKKTEKGPRRPHTYQRNGMGTRSAGTAQKKVRRATKVGGQRTSRNAILGSAKKKDNQGFEVYRKTKSGGDQDKRWQRQNKAEAIFRGGRNWA